MIENFKCVTMTTTDFGFTDNLKPMQKAKVWDQLDKLVRYNNFIMSEKEFVRMKLKEGNIPELVEDFSYYSPKTNDYTKPRNDYRLVNETANRYTEVTKTLYQYACFLLENDFINDEKALQYVTAANEKQQEEARTQKEAEEKAAQDKLKQEQERKDFDLWVWSEVERLKAQDTDRIGFIENIYLSEINAFADHMIRLLVYIDNIDNPSCRQKLIDWLNISNEASKKAFYHVTGVKLPNTNKETLTVLENLKQSDYMGMVSYSKRKERQEVEYNQPFYIRKLDTIEKVMGRSITISGIDRELFERKEAERYYITDVKTGLLLFSAGSRVELNETIKSRRDAIIEGFEKQKKSIEQAEEKMLELLSKSA